MCSLKTVYDKQITRRDSNIELFRIITMIAIVAHHYVVNSGLLEVMYNDSLNSKSIFLFIFGAWGKIGINCFVFITGYFMCKSNITARKFAKLLFEILFYNISIGLIFLATGYESLSVTPIIKLFIPVKSISYDFSSCYIVFFLCIPFINALLHNINENQHLLLLLLSGFIYIFLGSLPGFNVTMNYLSWFIVLYFISSYVRLYPKAHHNKTKLWSILSAICTFICIVSIFVSFIICNKLGLSNAYYFVADSNKFFAVITGFSLFMLFMNIKIPYIKFINTIASSTFGVLLIHANSDAMRQWLWKDTLNNVGMYNSPYLYFHAIGSVIAVFVICVVIDQIRIRLIEVPFFNLWDKFFPLIKCKYRLVEEKIFKKLIVKSGQ